jgi:anti-sigma B factor antagonist
MKKSRKITEKMKKSLHFDPLDTYTAFYNLYNKNLKHSKIIIQILKEIYRMTIDIKKNGKETTIEVVGRLDTITAPGLEKTINENIGVIQSLVIDFKGLEYISSAGLRVLLGAQKKMKGKGSVKLIGVCEDVMEIFEMTGFSDILTIEKI